MEEYTQQACVTLGLIARIDDVHLQPTQTTQNDENESQKMVSHFNDVFSGLGLNKSNATIHVDKNVTPVIDPPHKIPFAIQDQVRKELDRMIELGL